MNNGGSMGFDLHQYDHLDGELDEKHFEKYVNALVARFHESEEGAALLLRDPDSGHWVKVFLDYGYWHIGVLPTRMTRVEAKEILTDLFPRKVAISSKEETAVVISELVAFWGFLEREHRLSHASSILAFLQELEPEFYGMMNDSSRFGMAKSFAMMGTEMGFDMTDEADMQRFMLYYNEHIANTASEPPGIQRALPPRRSDHLKRMCQSGKTRNQRKRMRQRKK